MRYTSAVSPYIIGLIEEKRSLGYKYSSQPEILHRFDRFCCELYPNESVLSREIMLAWASKRPGEHPCTLQGRITPVKELAKYMVRLGHEAFILPKGMMPRIPRYMPHIYSNDELKRIFAQTDQCEFCSEVPYRHYVMPVFFRLLYCCGLRLTEARFLRTCLHKILHASFRQILPMTASKFLEIRKYSCGIFPCPRQNLLENPRTNLVKTGS